MEQKTGRRSEGIIFSVQTFLAKLVGAFGGMLSGLLLVFEQYKPNATQSEATSQYLFGFITLFPALGGLLALSPQ